MHKIDDISSILNAVNHINLKPKKKTSNPVVFQNLIPKLNQDLAIPPDLDKIIIEAEQYKKSSSFKSYQVDAVQKKNDISEYKNYKKNFEETEKKIIDNLHLKIKGLEDKLKNFHIKKKQTLNKNKIILKDEFIESLESPNASAVKLNKVLSGNKNYLKDEIVTSLKIQDSTIDILNEKIKKFKNTEEKLRLQIIDLEQDKTLLLKKVKNSEEEKDYKNIINDIKNNLKSIYRQVAQQKKIFLDLKNYSIKTERDFSFYKENYEKLIIENDNIKKKLSNTKHQIEAFEEIKKELASTFENFNNVLSKNSIIKLNESFSKIASSRVIPDVVNKKIK